MAAAFELARPTELLNPRLMKQGEASPYKLLVSILLREYYTHSDLKPVEPVHRIAIGIFFYRLICVEDMSYKSFIAICKEQVHHKRLAVEVLISFIRIIENALQANPCFLNELVCSLIEMINTSQTVILRKRVTRTSPLGKFLRLIMLSIRKMSSQQVTYLYRQFWQYIKKDKLENMKSLVQPKLPQLLNKGFQKLYLQQHVQLSRSRPWDGLQSFNDMMRNRAFLNKARNGAFVYAFSKMGAEYAYCKDQFPTHPNRNWDEVKSHSRKLIDRTVGTLSSNFYKTGSRIYTPTQISHFVECIQSNPSSSNLLSQLHFLEYLNSLQVKDFIRSSNYLRTSFDLKSRPSSSDVNRNTPHAAYNFALLYDFFGYREDALTLLDEAFQAAHACSDKMCLQYCNNLWATMHHVSYKGAIHESIKEMDKPMAYLHSFNVTKKAFELHVQGKRPPEIFKMMFRSATGLDFENTQPLLVISASNFFSIFGNYQTAGIVAEVLLNTAHKITWSARSYCSALLLSASSALMDGDFDFADALMEDYGQKLFSGEATVAGELFGKHFAIQTAMRCFLGRKPIDDSVIATIRGFEPMESYYWNAYNKILCKDWHMGEKLIRHLWQLLKVKSSENGDMAIRIFLLEAEISCAIGNPIGALQSLFSALRLSTKLSANFYIMLSQLSISTIQLFLGFPNTAAKTLQLDTMVKCRNCCKLLQAKLCIVTVKISMRLNLPIPSPTKREEPDFGDLYSLFQRGNSPTIDWSPEEPKRLKTSAGGCEDIEVDENDDTGLKFRFCEKLMNLLHFADTIFHEYENDCMRLEALHLQCELYHQTGESGEVRRIKTQILRIGPYDPEYYKRTCFI